MKVFTITEPPTTEAIKVLAKARGLDERLYQQYQHPQEDYFDFSKSPPIFAVADGVTLNIEELIKRNIHYPDPSPAGKVAEAFCKEVVKTGVNLYPDFNESSLKLMFTQANQMVSKINQKSPLSGNPTGYFAATGAYLVLKDSKAYWATICDARIACFDKEMRQKFISSGNCRPYAVINGQDHMVEHLETGTLSATNGDILLVMTDGYEHYLNEPEFLDIFARWKKDIKQQLINLSKKLNQKDPAKFGRERTLVAIKV